MTATAAATAAARDDLVPVSEADYLEQDPLIRGQRFACISFISPQDAIASKDAYTARSFLGAVAKDLGDTLDSISAAFEGSVAVQDTVRSVKERHAYLWDAAAAQGEYALYRSQQAEEIDEGFKREHGEFKTSVHAFKIRGVYDSVDEATARAKAIERFDKRFNVFVSEVGCWCPWSPSADSIENVEYSETQLNTLMKKYNEGQDARDEVYNTRKDEKVTHMNREREIWVERLKAQMAARKKEEEDEKNKTAETPEDPADPEEKKAPADPEEKKAPEAPEEKKAPEAPEEKKAPEDPEENV